MDETTLSRAKELIEIINVTKAAIYNLKDIQNNDVRVFREKRYYDDGLYGFNVGVNKDNSGKKVELQRYEGNVELLEVIINKLEQQLLDFETEFSRL